MVKNKKLANAKVPDQSSGETDRWVDGQLV